MESMNLDLTKTYRLAAPLHVKENSDGLLIMDPKTYAVHELNESAAIVVRFCDGDTSCEEIVARIVEEHGQDTHSAARIVYHGLALLKSQGLIECL